MKVVFYQRRPLFQLNYGIEQVFDTIRENLPNDICPKVEISPHISRRVWPRMINILAAALRQGDVNHVTGDIHYVTFLLRRHKTVLTVHDCGFENHPSRARRFVLRWLWLRIPASRVAAITTISAFSKSRIVAHLGCNPDKVVVIGDCIAPVFRRHDKPFNALSPTVLHVGTSPNKNLERVCEALVGTTCTLRVIGPLSDHQEAVLKSSGIKWSNRVGLSNEELYQTYAECDVVMFASTYEGFGLPIIEGNTVGRPVVTSSITSMPEIAGGSACLVDPYDAASIRDGILRVIHDEPYRASLVEKGFRNASRFTPAQCASEYCAIYERLAL